MRKTLITMLLAMVAVVQAVAAVGDRFSSGYLTYTVLTEPTGSSYGTVSVYGLSSSGQSASNLSLTIPTQVANGSSTYDVTVIRPIAFDGATNLIAVTVRYGVKSIGQQAFQGCSNILLVRLPSSLTFLGKNAFYGCDDLGQIYFAAPTPAGLTLANGGPFPRTFNDNIDVYVGKGDANGLPLWQKKLEEYSFRTVAKNSQACDMEWTNAGTYRGLCMTVTQAPTYSSNGKCRVVGFVNNGATMTVPPCTYLGVNNNYRVDFTEIADSAMMNNTLITSVDLSNAQSLTYVGMSAFEGSYITSAKQQFRTAANRAFYNCPKLKTLTFVSRSDDEMYALGSSVFTGNPELTTVNIEPNSVYSLSFRAFYNCPKLSSVTLGEGMLQLASNVFEGCSSLTSLTIPASVTLLSTGPQSTFYGCTNLNNISVNSNNGFYSSYAGALYNKEQTTLLCVPEGYTNLQGFPYTLTTIGAYAFINCKKITEQEIPYGVTTIGSRAFQNCTALTRLHLPSSVTSLGDGMCYNCTALSIVSANMAAAPTITPGTFFWGKSQIARLYTPFGAEQEYQNKGWNIFATVNDDHHYAYDFMKGSTGTNLCYTVGTTTVSDKWVNVVRGYIPSTTIATERNKYIGNKTTEQTINIPQQVSYRGNTYNLNAIGSYTFTAEGTAAPTGVLTVNLPGTVTTLKAWSFYRSRVKSLSMPGVVTIGTQAFREGTLTSMQFPHTLQYVDGSAFMDCGTLTGDAIFPYGLKQLGASIFSGTQISKVVIPSSVTMLNNNALNGMSKWVTAYINLPANSVSSSLSLPSSTLAHLYVPYNEELGYKDKFPDLSGKIYTGGYDFAEKTRNGGYLHYSVTDNTAHTWNGTQFAGKAMIVFNPDASAAPTTLSVTADAHDNALGGSNIYRVTRYDGYCLARCPSQQMNDQGAWESIEEIGAHAFDNSKFAYHIDWADHRSDLFRVGPQVTKIEFAPFKECNMAGMFLEPASGQRSSGVFKESGGNFVCYASYDDKYMNNLLPTNPDILSIYYQKDGVTSDVIYSPVPIYYASAAKNYEGFSAYAVTGHNGDVAQAEEIASAPAGTAVMIRKNADNKPIYFTRLKQDPDWTGQTNLLWGNLNYTALHSNDYAYDNANEQWVNANNTTTEIGHGYLRRTDSETPATMTVNYITYGPYDMNRDGKVDPDDANYWLQNKIIDPRYDINRDNYVNNEDIIALLTYLIEENPMQFDYTPYVNLRACDLNDDGFLNDGQSVVDFILTTDYDNLHTDKYDLNGDGWTDSWDVVICYLSIRNSQVTSYGVQVFKTTVTSLTYNDVLHDGTVSYNPETHTLTLNNANIKPVGQDKDAYIVNTDEYLPYHNTAVIQVNDRAIFGEDQVLNVKLIGENHIAVKDWYYWYWENNDEKVEPRDVVAFHVDRASLNIMGNGSLDITESAGVQLAAGTELKICDGAKVSIISSGNIGIIGPSNYNAQATNVNVTVDKSWLKDSVSVPGFGPIWCVSEINLVDAEYVLPENPYFDVSQGALQDGEGGDFVRMFEIVPTSTSIPGDVDGDGKVDVTDVTITIDIILGKANASDYPGNADIDGDNKVDVTDLNIIIDIVLGRA